MASTAPDGEERLQAAFVLGKKPQDIHVLLVDDERVSRLVVGNLLRKCHYQVTVASSGLDALEILRRHEKETFHLILTDVMMPDVDGIELLKHIRSDEAFNSMPVVMMSANEHTETVFECIRRGAEDYLLKPVTKKEVQYICQHVWRRQKQVPSRIPFVDSDQGHANHDTHMAEVDESSPNYTQTDIQALITAQLSHHDAILQQTAQRPESPPTHSQIPHSQPVATSQHHHRLSEPVGSATPPAPGMVVEGRPPGSVQEAAPQPPVNGLEFMTQSSRRHSHVAPTERAALHGNSAPFKLLAPNHQSGDDGGQSNVPERLQPSRGARQTSLIAQQAKIPISVYFGKRGNTVNSTESFQIFSSAVALVQAHHARGEVVKVRPSRLCIRSSGKLVRCDSRGKQAEFEDKLYASPEELLTKPLSMASDLYSLGVLFFELFHPVTTGKERFHVLSGLRHRQLPLSLLSERPQEAEFVLALLHPDPSSRPSAAKLMQPGCLTALQNSINKSQDGGKGSQPLDFSALFEFLKKMQQKKSSEVKGLQSQIAMLDDDISQVNMKLKALFDTDKQKRSTENSSDSNGSVSSQGKRERDWEPHNSRPMPSNGSRKSFDEAIVSGEQLAVREKWKRIWEEHPVLENLYLRRREAQLTLLRLGAAPHNGPECAEENRDCTKHVPDRLADLGTDLAVLAKPHTFEVKATLKYGDLMGEGDMVCAAAFDRDDEYFATAGVSKHIKIFETEGVLKQNAVQQFPVLEIGVNSKISSLCWNVYVKMCMLAADYDGGIQLWDVSTNSITAQFDEHLKRVWSVDFSQTDPTRFVSGSDDGTVKLWSMRDNGAVATIDSKANVCSVQLCTQDSNLLAFGSANYKAYLYDLRKMAVPLSVIEGHRKAVSYVRFLDSSRLVTASTDDTLKLWDLTSVTSGTHHHCGLLNTFSGHSNQRNFVGMSVNSDGYIACGSESNELFLYYNSIPTPLTKHSFGCQSRSMDSKLQSRQFVSTVCWARKRPQILAANSSGVIKILSLTS